MGLLRSPQYLVLILYQRLTLCRQQPMLLAIALLQLKMGSKFEMGIMDLNALLKEAIGARREPGVRSGDKPCIP
jgi:hypothetical protein